MSNLTESDVRDMAAARAGWFRDATSLEIFLAFWGLHEEALYQRTNRSELYWQERNGSLEVDKETRLRIVLEHILFIIKNKNSNSDSKYNIPIPDTLEEQIMLQLTMPSENDEIDFWPEYREWYDDMQFEKMQKQIEEEKKATTMSKWLHSLSVDAVCSLLKIKFSDYAKRVTVTRYSRKLNGIGTAYDVEVIEMAYGDVVQESEGAMFASCIGMYGKLCKLYYDENR